jgi:hypothetical protein
MNVNDEMEIKKKMKMKGCVRLVREVFEVHTSSFILHNFPYPPFDFFEMVVRMASS